jgi:uncharacterized repeat protein (TIGR01451 family)
MKPLKLAGKWPQGLLLILPVILSLFTAPVARSEGSRELTDNTGDRPFLEYRDDLDPTSDSGTPPNGIPRRTTIKVYARENETINLGSSAVGVGGGEIRYRSPNGTDGICDDPNFGLIQNRTQEIAGPAPNPSGYTPCTVTVLAGQEGVWEIEFVSPNPANTGNPTPIAATANWPPQGTNNNFVTAWDVTVRDAGGAEIRGRAFANFLAMNASFRTNPSSISPLNSEAFVLTEDGFIYRVNLNGQRPAGFIFYANKNGFLDANGDPIFQSVGVGGEPIFFDNPSLPENDNLTHKIFFNNPTLGSLPNNGMVPAPPVSGGSTWLRNQPEPPPSPSNFQFIGQEGTLGQAGTNPLGGRFEFDSNGEGTYRLIIDIGNNGTGNGVYGDENDVILQGRVFPGTNTVEWDGKDKNGDPVQVSELGYGARIQFFGGEVHFPFFDVEQNPNGLIVERLNQPPGFPANNPNSDPFLVYYDDSGFPENLTIQPDPLSALAGDDSSNGAHAFQGSSFTGWGDNRGIDTWVLFPSLPFELEQRIVIAEADLQITKAVSPTPAVAGGNITYTITVTNAGPSNIRTTNPATVSDIFTANGETVTILSWTCEIIPPDPPNPPAGAEEGTCIDESGTGNLTDARLALDATFSARYTLTGTIDPDATETIENQARVTRPNDVADPENDDDIEDIDEETGENLNNRFERANVTVPLTPGNPLLGVAKQLNTVVNNGDGTYDATYTIRVENFGNLDILNLQVTEDLFGNAESTFASAVAAPEIVAAPQIVAGTLTGVNPDFNGEGDKNLLSGDETLLVGESIDITFTVRVTPGSQLGPYENTATATGSSPGGTLVSDDSTDDENLNPDPNNDGNPNDSTPTAVTFGEVPLIGVAKAVGTPTDNGDRTFTIPYTLVVRNYGDVPLNTVQVTENLNETFADLTYTLEPNSLSSPTLTVNPSFDGDTDINLLEADNSNNTLAVDTEATINFAVRVTPGNNLGPFNNQVTASGVTPGGTGVNDLSTNGSNPDGNNTGDPTDSNEITSVTLRGNPNLELEKRITRVNGIDVGQSENLADWPDNFVRGLAASNTIQPGDEVEYTIYFLSAGSGPLENATVCDPLQDFQTFRTDTFNGQTPIEGTFGAEVGIALALNPPNPDVPTAYLRSANSASNRGRFYPAGTATPLICEQNVRGAVVVDIGNLGVGDYGFIRFRVTID